MVGWRGEIAVTARNLCIAKEPWNSCGGRWDFGISLAEDGKTWALVRQSLQQPPEIRTGEIGAWKQLTRHNTGVHPRRGKAAGKHWSNDGMKIQGWLLYPVNYGASNLPAPLPVPAAPDSNECIPPSRVVVAAMFPSPKVAGEDTGATGNVPSAPSKNRHCHSRPSSPRAA